MLLQTLFSLSLVAFAAAVVSADRHQLERLLTHQSYGNHYKRQNASSLEITEAQKIVEVAVTQQGEYVFLFCNVLWLRILLAVLIVETGTTPIV